MRDAKKVMSTLDWCDQFNDYNSDQKDIKTELTAVVHPAKYPTKNTSTHPS